MASSKGSDDTISKIWINTMKANSGWATLRGKELKRGLTGAGMKATSKTEGKTAKAHSNGRMG